MSDITSARFAFIKGDTFTRTFHYYGPTGVDIDLTGQSFKFYIKTREDGEVFSLTTGAGANGNGSIFALTTALEGKAALTVTDEDTTLFDFKEGTWGIKLINGGTVQRIARGRVTVDDE